jgi:hypothetical protein
MSDINMEDYEDIELEDDKEEEIDFKQIEAAVSESEKEVSQKPSAV